MADIEKFIGWSYADIKTFANVQVLADTYLGMDKSLGGLPLLSAAEYWDFALTAALNLGLHFVKLSTQERLAEMRCAYIEMTGTV